MNDSNEEIDALHTVLDPDHPLLASFQRALKEHLQSQINRLKEEVFEIEDDNKKTEAEVVEIGVQAYEAQQQVCAQQKTLENILKDLETTTAANEEEENDLEKNKKDLRDVQDKLFLTDKTNRELLNEIESVTSLNQQLSAHESKMEAHINVNRRIADKSRQDNEQLAEEKRKQDYFIHQILSEVWKLENELETCKIQIGVKEEHLDELEQKIAIGNTNISALEAEIRGLMFSWNCVVVAVSNRDKGLECLTEKLNKLEEHYNSMMTQMDQLKKIVKKELLENEKNTMLKAKVDYDIKLLHMQLDEQMNKKAILDNEIYKVQSMMDQMEKDTRTYQLEVHVKQLKYNSLIEDYNKLAAKKLNIEEEIFRSIESQITNVKYGKKADKTLKELLDKRRTIEVTLSEAENKKSLLNSEIESQKFKNEELNRLNEDMKKNLEELESQADYIKAEIEKFELLYRKKEKQVLSLNNKLEIQLGSTELTKIKKEQMKITELTKLIEESQQAIKSLQVFWMREQKNILAVSNERQEQIHNINLLKKQVLILDQKNVRISDEIEELKRKEEKTQHNINMLTNKASILCEHLFKKKNHKTSLDRNNSLLQGEYDSKLRDAELQLLEIEAEIAEIEEDKLTLTKELLEINREGLEWEKQFQMAKEAVMDVRDSRREGGQLSVMRTEIHRMEVIYLQLKRAQEKLLTDMQHCVLRRDTLFYQSDSKQHLQKQKKNGDRTRIHYQKKLDNLKNQIKQSKSEISTNQNKIRIAESKIVNLRDEMEKRSRENIYGEDYQLKLKKKLEETKINRQFKFELLVYQQRKAYLYEQLTKNRTPFTIYRREEDLINEYHKEKEINNRLIKIAENLKNDFSDMETEFIKIRNTLGIVALCMYT